MSTSDIENKYAIAGSWGESPYQDVTVPSGQVCLVKKVDMEDLMLLGVGRETDTPTGVVAQHVAKAQGKVPSDHKKKQLTKAEQAKLAEDVAQDPEAFKKHAQLIRKVVCFAVQKPKIHSIPEPDPMIRENGVVYIDSIGFPDQMEIFKFAMSATTAVAETFRDGSTTDVGDVADEQDVPVPPE